MEFRLLFLILWGSLLAAQASGPSFEELSSRATAARTANDAPHAIELYRQATNLNPQWAEGWFYLGTLLYDNDRYADARDALAQLVTLQPNVTPALGLLGLCEFQTGDYAKALAHVQKSLAGGPAQPSQMDAVLRFHEAMLLARNGLYDQAIQKYAFFLRNTQPQATVLTAVGIAALRSPLVPKEVPAAQSGLYLAAGKATYYTLTGNYGQANPAFADLLAQFPKAPGVHYLHGFYLLAQSPEEAMAEFRREIELNPSHAAAQAMLAWALLNQGDASAALPYAAKAAQGEPSFPTAQYVYGRALADSGDVKKAIPYLEQAERLDASNLETHLALASAYSKAGRTKEAREERRRSVQLAKEVAPALQH